MHPIARAWLLAMLALAAVHGVDAFGSYGGYGYGSGFCKSFYGGYGGYSRGTVGSPPPPGYYGGCPPCRTDSCKPVDDYWRKGRACILPAGHAEQDSSVALDQIVEGSQGVITKKLVPENLDDSSKYEGGQVLAFRTLANQVVVTFQMWCPWVLQSTFAAYPRVSASIIFGNSGADSYMYAKDVFSSEVAKSTYTCYSLTFNLSASDVPLTRAVQVEPMIVLGPVDGSCSLEDARHLIRFGATGNSLTIPGQSLSPAPPSPPGQPPRTPEPHVYIAISSSSLRSTACNAVKSMTTFVGGKVSLGNVTCTANATSLLLDARPPTAEDGLKVYHALTAEGNQAIISLLVDVLGLPCGASAKVQYTDLVLVDEHVTVDGAMVPELACASPPPSPEGPVELVLAVRTTDSIGTTAIPQDCDFVGTLLTILAKTQPSPATPACTIEAGALRASLLAPSQQAAHAMMSTMVAVANATLLAQLRLTCGNVVTLRAGSRYVEMNSANMPALRCAPPPAPPTPPTPPPAPPSPGPPQPPSPPPRPPRPPRPPPSPPTPPPAARDSQNITWTWTTGSNIRQTWLPQLEYRLAAAYSIVKPVSCAEGAVRVVRNIVKHQVTCVVKYDTKQQALALVERVKGTNSSVLSRASQLLQQDCHGDVSVKALIEERWRLVGKMMAPNMNSKLTCGGARH